MEFMRVRNWMKFQHYKKRNPPWIKVETGTLDDYEYGCLDDATKALFFSILIIAGRTNNKIPADPTWIQQTARLKNTPDLEPLFAMRFIELESASELLAPCKQNAMPEERRGEAETEESRAKQSIQTERQKALREEAKKLSRRLA